jgi:hypothetical protein
MVQYNKTEWLVIKKHKDLGNQIKENMKTRAHTMFGGKEMHTELWWWNLEEGDCLKDRGIEGKDTITTDLKEIGWEGVAFQV